MTQTHENANSDRDHANVRFFPPFAYAAPMAAGLAMHFAFCAAVFGLTAN